MKCGSAAALEFERSIYQEVLPPLPLPSLRCYGFLEAVSTAWLFLEDAEQGSMIPAADRHPAALAQWLGELHISAAGLPGAWDVNDRLRAHANISKRDLATGRLIFRLGFRMSLAMGAAHAGVPAPGALGSIAPAHPTDGRPGRSGERTRSSSQ